MPYAQQSGTLETMLEKIKTASVPDKFSQDFVSTKLAMKGGTARATIPFIKKLGLVSSDGTPTKRYSEFRNSDKSGMAIAQGMREVYSTLFDMNEYAYELDSAGLKKLIIEATGAEADSTPVKKTLSTFLFLNKIADFEASEENKESEPPNPEFSTEVDSQFPVLLKNNDPQKNSEGINLSYTINLNLPPTTDIEVFNAIFKSLKQHLLQE